MNPYTNRGAISDPKSFFGRRKEIENIFSILANPSGPGAIGIVGERRIGKSSVLKYISNPVNYKNYLPEDRKYIFAFIDLTGLVEQTIHEFLKKILDQIKDSGVDGIDTNNPTMAYLEQTINNLSKSNITLVLLIDEFDKAYKDLNTVFTIEFYDALRSFTQNYMFGVITASRANIRNILSNSKEIFGSGFFNIFKLIYLGLFKKREALSLITEPSMEEDVDLTEFQDAILSFTGSHPFFMQITLDYFFQLIHYDEEKIEEDDLDDVFQEIKREPILQSVLESYFESLSPEQRDFLLDVIEQQPLENEFLQGDLKDRGYIVKDKSSKNRFAIFSTLFKEYFLQQLEKQAKKSDESVSNPLPKNVREIVYPFENYLRKVVRSVYINQYMDNWETRLEKDIRNKFKNLNVDKMIHECDKLRLNSVNTNEDPTEISLLNGITLGQLKDFICGNWGQFNTVICTKKEKFNDEMYRILTIRNLDYHSNPITEVQLMDFQVAVNRIHSWCA